MAFKDKVLASVVSELSTNKADHDWLLGRVTWENVRGSESLLSVYGADVIEPQNFGGYLKEKLHNAVLTGPGVITQSDLQLAIDDLVNSMKYAAESYRIQSFSSMETHCGGILRATVAVVLAKKGPATKSGTPTYGCVVYKAVYDLIANTNAHWWDDKQCLTKSKGWATYKAMKDFQANCDRLLAHLKDSGVATIATYSTTNELLASF